MASFRASAAAGPAVVLCGRDALRRLPSLHRYFQGFNAADRRARGLPAGCSTEDCAHSYLEGAVDPDDPRAGYALLALTAEVALAEATIARAGMAPWLGAARLAAPNGTPGGAGVWRVALLEAGVEGGFPHTHGDVVCLPLAMYASATPPTPWTPQGVRVQTLVHERVHVWQRGFPAEVARVMAGPRWGLTPLGPARDMLPAWLVARLRSNPDLDGQLYADNPRLRGGVAVQLYDTPTPASLGDSRLHVLRRVPTNGGEPGAASWQVTEYRPRPGPSGAELHEHPYEDMAYAIAAVAVSLRAGP